MSKLQYQILLRLDDEHMQILNEMSREQQISRQSIIKQLIKKEAKK